ncbi:MAG: alpha/beta hydrolase [Alphaproteobacteria bacterium]|nr:alpha/beta hydrolase [Alphaproteobacteria bacterium]
MLRDYRAYDRAALELQYETDGEKPDSVSFVRAYERDSAGVRRDRRSRLDVAYGTLPGETMDIFLADRPNAPILVFIHGGYWKGGNKEFRAFLAPTYCDAGAIYISLEYPLTPGVTLDRLVAAVRAGIAWVWHHAAEIGGDRDRIHVCGNSAGGHLVAMLMAPGWKEPLGLPDTAIAGGCAISGLFELEQFRDMSQNGWLRLDEADITRNSPIRLLPDRGRPLIVAVGANESDEFLRQSRSYGRAWIDRGFPLVYLEVPGTQHFSIVGAIGAAGSPLRAAIFAQMGIR